MSDFYIDINGNVTKNTDSKKKKKKKQTDFYIDINGNVTRTGTADDDIAPVKESTEKRTWFEKGAFEDGYQFGDVFKTAVGTVRDVEQNLTAGILGIGEAVVDAGAYLVGGVGGLFGADEFADKTKKFIADDLIDEKKAARAILGAKNPLYVLDPLNLDDSSALGDKTDSVVQSGGQLIGTIGLQAVGVPWFVTSGVTSFGKETESAFKEGASYGEAGISGLITAGAEILTEKIFGGSGLGEKGLINLDGLTKGISRKGVKLLADFGLDVVGEGGEEVASEFLSTLGQQLSYEKEDTWKELLTNEEAMDRYLYQVADSLFGKEAWANYGEAAIGGMLLGGVANTGKAVKSNKAGRDYRTGLTENEQKVFDSVYNKKLAEAENTGKKLSKNDKAKIYDDVMEELQKGKISVEDIEEALGGDSYKAYKDTIDKEDAAIEEIKSLYNDTTIKNEFNSRVAEAEANGKMLTSKEKSKLYKEIVAEKRAEFEEAVKGIRTNPERIALKQKLGKEVFDLAKQGKDAYLLESFDDAARRGQDFQADLNEYKNDYAKQTVKNIMEAKSMNNTRASHQMVNFMAKMSADKGVVLSVTDAKKLAQTGLGINGKTINGYKTDDGIVVNLSSEKSLNFIVGHEISHVLENTEFYQPLQEAIFEYAKKRKSSDGKFENEYAERLYNARQLYKDVKGYEGVKGHEKIRQEVVADLVGDYLFSDPDFVKHLSTEHRNVFQKIYDEIKYLLKVVTAGSKEEKELLKVKKAFEDAYRADSKAQKNTVIEDGVQYSLADMEKITPSTEQVDSNMQEVAQMSPVYVVDESKLAPNGKDFKDIYGEYFIEWGENIHTDLFGDVAAKKSSIRSEIRHGSTAEKIAAIEAIPSVIQNGKIVDWIEKQRGVYRIIVAAPISIGDTPYVMGVMLQRDSQYQRLYLHDVVIEKEASTSLQDDLISTGSDKGGDSLYTTSILQKILNVKKNLTSSEKNSADSNGKQLSEGQKEYFKDSKVVDENGNLKVMYHGTSKGGFTVFDTYGSKYGLFGQGSYFTDNKSVAESYTKKGKGNNPQVYESYLNITNPMDMDAEADADAWRKAFPDATFPESGTNEDFYRAVEDYFEDEGYYKYEAAEELVSTLESMGYDGITHIGGGRRNNTNDTSHRVYIAFNPEQIKNTDNTNPTENPDIRFSLSKSVEETKELMAIHNLSEEKLLKSLKLGGLPMPSVAIAKAKDGHNEFGDISLILQKDAIDPKTSRNNKLYSGDAWTPTYPRVEYKVNKKVLEQISDKVHNLVPSDVISNLGRVSFDTDNMTDELNRWGGNVVDAFGSNDALKYAYLKDIGADIALPMKDKNISYYGYRENGAIIKVAEALTAEELREAINNDSSYDIKDKYEPIIRKAVAEYVQEKYADTPELLEIMIPKEQLTFSDIDGYLTEALHYHSKGVEQTVDIKEARELISAEVNQSEYEAWLRDLFSGIVEKEGIRNNADYFTPSGNRRSFEALHYEHNLENVVKAMRDKGAKGIGVIGGNIFGASTTEYSSIKEMKQNSDRLKKMSQDEYDEIRKEYTDRFFDLAYRLPIHKDSFTATSDAGDMLVEAVAKYSTRSGIANYLRKESQGWANYSEDIVDDLIELVNDIRSMPTGYFEAKPQRAVGFDEVGVFVIPRNSDVKLKQELLNRGYAIAEYDPDVEGDRQKVVNSFEEYKFSLSNASETPKSYGSFNIYGKDVMLEEDIAPIGEGVAENATTTKETVSKMEQVEDIAPMPDEIDETISEWKNLSNRQYEAIRPKQTKEPKMARVTDNEGAKTTERLIKRSELHRNKMDGIKAKFAKNGLDLDEVLKKAKDLSTFSTVDNTPQRVMEKSLGYKEGQILADETVNKVAQNETEGIKWLNSFTDRKSGMLKKISDRYHIKPGSKESAAAQMYAEGFYVDDNNNLIKYGDAELAKDFPDARVQNNIKALARDPRIRRIYDDTLKAINESRVRNGYPEIQRLDNYFLHFRAMNDTFSRLGLPFNPNDIRAKDLPTDLNGVTADLKPGQPYFASAMHRRGQRTSFDLLGGLERYLSSAKNQIYHIDDIQTFRALRNYIADMYGQAKGLESLDELSEAEARERIDDVFKSHLSTFAKFLNDEANILAGKTDMLDRAIESRGGRRFITFMDTLNRQVGSNMVGYNISSALTNLIAPVQAFAKMNKTAFVKGFAQTVSNRVKSISGKGDGFADASPVMIRRKGADRFHRTAWQKISDPGYALMGAVDNFSTELIARAKYNELTAKGMASDKAHLEADKWVSRLMGDRSLGQMPQLYNSKTLGLITKFQLEVRNQLDSQFYDTIKEAEVSTEDIQNGRERNAKKAAKIASTFFTLAVSQHLFGKVFESIAGYNPAFDIISVLIKTLGLDDDEESEDTALDNIEQGFFELMGDMPYTSILEGGRIPIASALPIEELYKGVDQYGNEKSRLETIKEALPYYLMPGGYGQAKKTIQGLSMFDEDHPIAGSYTDSGNLRFPVEDTLGNRIQAGIFGQWASENARDYFDNDYAPLKEKQIQEFVDLDIPIGDYRKIREDLAKLDTLGEKAVYIAGLDLPMADKNLLINNIADREEPIDLTGLVEYGDFGEFEYAKKYPNKYEFLKENNISYEEYQSFDEDTKEAWSWAYQNPGKFTLSKAIASDVVVYKQYTKALNSLKADKDENGDSISGSRKEKVIEYINGLDAEYGEKIVLFKSAYKADNTYNYEIIDYLNGRDDLSYEDVEAILKELGFDVDSEGNISW